MKKRLISMMLAVATAISFTACSGVEANTSRTSSVESSSIAESTVSTTATSADSKADTTTTASSESEVSSTTTTNSSSEDTTTESTSSTSPKEEKIEERDVYDEDGNVVDKIKVKVVDGVAYTVGEKSDDKCILDGVPLYTNDPEFPSGDILTIVQTVIYMKGEKVTQKEIFEKYADYHTPDEWYEEDYVKYGPTLCEEKLVQDPRLEPTNYFNGGLGNVIYYCEKFFEEHSIETIRYSSKLNDVEKLYDRLKILADEDHLPVVTVNNKTKNIWKWVTKEMKAQGILDGNYVYLTIGYFRDKFIVYDVKYNKILSMDCTIDVVYSI